MQNSLMSGGWNTPADEDIGKKRNQDERRDNSKKSAGENTKQQRTLVEPGDIEQNICEHRESAGNPPSSRTNLPALQDKRNNSTDKKAGINARAACAYGEFASEKVERTDINLVADPGIKGNDVGNNGPERAFTGSGNGRQDDAEAPHKYRRDEK
jgi:hypothetical protein